MISVAEAEARILEGAGPEDRERVGLAAAAGRVLAEDAVARRTHPPHDVSAMDGYAVRHADIAASPATLPVGFAVAAGAMPPRGLRPGEAARIFTGAVVPEGADTVVIQENTRVEAGRVTILEAPAAGRNVRKAGYDFAAGAMLLPAGTRLGGAALGLLAGARVDEVAVWRRPRVALLATGDELVPPGADPVGAQIIASTGVALGVLLAGWGAEVVDLGIARDDADEIRARAEVGLGADLLLTQGGASVGDHDLIQPALAPLGLTVGFWKIAMRPGKPLMSGRIGSTRVIGLPGNPVSALVCALLFVQPLVRVLGGERWHGQRLIEARLGAPLGPNDQRQDYLRARVALLPDGPVATAMPVQDSGNLSAFARAGGLIVRPPHAPAAAAGDVVRLLPLGPEL